MRLAEHSHSSYRPWRPGRVAAPRAPDSWPRGGSFGKGHSGCIPRRTGHCRLLPHSPLRAPGRSRFREGVLRPHSARSNRGAIGRSRTPGFAHRVAAVGRYPVAWTPSLPSGFRTLPVRNDVARCKYPIRDCPGFMLRHLDRLSWSRTCNLNSKVKKHRGTEFEGE